MTKMFLVPLTKNPEGSVPIFLRREKTRSMLAGADWIRPGNYEQAYKDFV